jgi:hypothetical protein
MPDHIDFRTEAEDLFKTALRDFAEWMAKNWTTTEEEALTLSEPTRDPQTYARAFNDALEQIPAAMEVYLEGQLPL